MAREPDPRAELKSLERTLEGGLPSGVVLRGAEPYFRGRARNLVVEAARAAGHELCLHDAKGPEFELSRVLDDLVGGALFSSARCIVVDNPEDLLKKVGTKDSSFTRAVRSFLEGERGTLVLSSKSVRADAAAVKAVVAAGGAVHSFRKLWDAPPPWERNADPRRTELVSFVVGEARERGLRLTPDQAALLVKRTGNELDAIAGQLEGLRGADVDQALGAPTEGGAGSPFQVADELVAGRAGTAVAGIEGLFRGGMRKEKDGTRERGPEALMAILMGTVRGRVRDGLAVSMEMAGGAPFKAAADAVGVNASPMARKKLEELCAGRDASDWRRMLDDVLAFERRSRSGKKVDASDLARLALRWRRRTVAAR